MATKVKYVKYKPIRRISFGKSTIEYSGPKPELFTAAAIGAGVGAVLGYLKGGTPGAVIGAGLGAILFTLIEQILESVFEPSR